MKDSLTFLDCPAFIDADGGQRCCLPAHVRFRYIMNSTGGPLEGAVIRCPAGHRFNGPIESLAFEKHFPAPTTPRRGRHGQRLPVQKHLQRPLAVSAGSRPRPGGRLHVISTGPADDLHAGGVDCGDGHRARLAVVGRPPVDPMREGRGDR